MKKRTVNKLVPSLKTGRLHLTFITTTTGTNRQRKRKQTATQLGSKVNINDEIFHLENSIISKEPAISRSTKIKGWMTFETISKLHSRPLNESLFKAIAAPEQLISS
ncbi:hypothetical protein Zmor_000172 [Zophobas morio]|uniref:Uncharacterized protein n=1 Tax=Zophobas morio TaxID=2755281 RepID=A0AA38IVT1_9CUCU|nr:hypothetical protein Zmor_000172 [Zophobas morio]